jgi:hypothetical protein
MLALERAPGETSGAPSACLRERPYDVIADLHLPDVSACCCHNPRDLMTQHRRRRHDLVSGEQEVRMTQARRLHVDENFTTSRRGDAYLLEVEPTTKCINYECLHVCPPTNLPGEAMGWRFAGFEVRRISRNGLAYSFFFPFFIFANLI